MKKALLIGLALGLLVGAWAVPATAIDWSASGLIYVAGAVHENVPSLAPYWSPGTAGWWDKTWAWVRMGASLNITAKTSDDLFGVLSFNMVSDRWGEPDVQGWGMAITPNSDVNSLGSWYKKETGGALTVLVKDAFIDFRVPPNLPVRMRVGVQPIIIRPKVFMFYDGPGISMPITIEPVKLTITPAWYKKWEGADFLADDSDVLAVTVGIPIGPVNVGGFFWWENHNKSWGALGFFPVFQTGVDADLWWLGANSDGKIGPVGYELDFVYQGGTIEAPALDIQAWMLRGQVSVSLIPGLTFGVGGAYSTGEDYATAGTGERYVQPNAAENWYLGTFGAPFVMGANGCPPLQDFLLMDGNFMGIVPCFGPSASYLHGPTSIGGIWNIRGFAQYMVTDWMRVAANFGYIGDTSSGGDTMPGTNVYNAGGSVGDNDDIGFELDVGVAVNLYKNLVVGTAFGVLFAGDAMNVSVPAPLSTDPGNPWIWQLGIGYFF